MKIIFHNILEQTVNIFSSVTQWQQIFYLYRYKLTNGLLFEPLKSVNEMLSSWPIKNSDAYKIKVDIMLNDRKADTQYLCYTTMWH
jgi:hypothetical protein